MSASDRREERVSYARQRASIMSSGFSGTVLKMPDGLKFYEAEAGTAVLEFIPYIVGKGNPVVQEPGKLYYERTYWIYRKIGADEKAYVCSSKTFGKPDYIQELRNTEAKKPSVDKDYLKSLSPQMKQLFLVWDHGAPEKGIQLWDFSAHNFGGVLDDSIQMSPESKGWDFFYYPDSDGFTLEVALKKEKFAGHEYLKAARIDFTKRDERTLAKVKELFEEVKQRNWCLDSFLLETPYEKLRRIFHSLPDPETDGGDATTHQESADRPIAESDKGGRAVAADSRPANAAVDPDNKKRVTEIGYFGYKNGLKRADNPCDSGTERHQWWLDGWLAAAEEGPPDKKEGSKKSVTAAELGIIRGSEVVFGSEKHSVIRVCDDGTLNLMNLSDEIIKGVSVADVFVAGKTEAAKGGAPNSRPVDKAEDTKPAVSGGIDEAWDSQWK